MKFLLKGGTHIEAGRTYKSGDVIESDLDLKGLFKEKFQQVGDEMPATQGEKENVPDVPRDPAVAPPAEAAPVSLGNDVTAKFPEAEKLGLLVFKNKKVYLVADETEPGVAINKETLVNVGGVEEFIEKMKQADGE